MTQPKYFSNASTTVQSSSSSTDLPYYISILLWPNNARWNKNEASGTPKTVTYSFMQVIPDIYQPRADGSWNDDDLELNNFQPLSTAQREAVRKALSLYSDVSGLQFVEDSTGNGNLKLGTATDVTDFALGWAYAPDDQFGGKQGHVWLNNNAAGINNPLPGTDAFQTITHELGHALGLKHPFDQWPNPTLPDFTPENSLQYTIMAYDPHFQYENRAAPKTLMLYDIAAIQYLYGTNLNTRTGDDVYQWRPDATFLETIWDAGGTDTISAENQQRGVVINLKAGEFSGIGSNFLGAYENLAIAYGVTIENAIGGEGNDWISGNRVANSLEGRVGDDWLEAGEGNDILDGGTGADFMAGGLGDEIYQVDHPLDDVAESLGEGQDTIIATIDDYQLPQNVENLSLAGNASSGFGNDLNNQIQGNDSDNVLVGGAGNDTLMGGAGSDQLWGDAEDDFLSGGAGKDRLTGGEGADWFVVSTTGQQADRVTDFLSDDGDRLFLATQELGIKLRKGKLSAKRFVISSEAGDANDRLIYHAAAGKLFFDADGTGKAQPILLMHLAKGTFLTSNDIFVTPSI